jgi:hypothetical protein
LTQCAADQGYALAECIELQRIHHIDNPVHLC